MQTVKFLSHRARNKAIGMVQNPPKRVIDAGGVYGTYEIEDVDYLRLKHIKGVRRIAGKSTTLKTTRCEL